MKLTLEEAVREGAIRVDLAWQLFFGSKSTIRPGHGGGLIPFATWLWDELGRNAGHLNKASPAELTLSIPSLGEDALDFLLRLASFWSDEVYVKKGDHISENLWKRPVVNVLDDVKLDQSERMLQRKEESSYQRFFMPLLGPGRAFFRVEVLENGESSARFHSHSSLDEYYLILEGTGTLRYNGKELDVKQGDLIGKPAGPDSASQLIADRGGVLRILDMEIWHDRPYSSKDVVLNPDFNEIIMRGPGWKSLFPADMLAASTDFIKHYGEGYRRTRDGGWVPSRARGHKKIREKPSP